MARLPMDGRGKWSRGGVPPTSLSQVEKRILEALRDGCTVEEAGSGLDISPALVAIHIKSVCDKAFPTEERLAKAFRTKLLE